MNGSDRSSPSVATDYTAPPQRRHLTLLASAALAVIAGSLHAQAAPSTKIVRHKIGPVRGFASSITARQPATCTRPSGFALVVLIPDQSGQGNRMIHRWPAETVARKDCILVAPNFRSDDYWRNDGADMRAMLQATVSHARRLWRIDQNRIFLIGEGSGAGHALDSARAAGPTWQAVVAIQADEAWVAADSPAVGPRPPTLLLSLRSKQAAARASASEAALRTDGVRVIAVHDTDKRRKNFTAHGQRILEWCLDRAQEIDREQAAKKAAKLKEKQKKKKKKKPLTKTHTIAKMIRRRTEAASGAKEGVVVIKGTYDQVEDVLETLEIPHVTMTWPKFAKFDLSKTAIVLINCSDGEDFHPVQKKVVPQLRRMVMRGGYVFSTDWAVRYPIVDVFPKFIGWSDPNNKSAMMSVRPGDTAANHPLLQNVFPYDHPDPKWQLDGQSWLMKLVSSSRVTILLQSDSMAKAYDNSAIGALLRVGSRGGSVLNVVSHFNHQGDGGAAAPMWQLIVNFINSAKTNHRQRTARRKRR